ncbi:hypothetical protein AURDEDRAFT_127259 [Auricularia subglabra TFB-10046 SS5]|nr:hypothetical protein AURDEDRAFT_127259 [Auricularia subglabra TFB-10046 SS5]
MGWSLRLLTFLVLPNRGLSLASPPPPFLSKPLGPRSAGLLCKRGLSYYADDTAFLATHIALREIATPEEVPQTAIGIARGGSRNAALPSVSRVSNGFLSALSSQHWRPVHPRRSGGREARGAMEWIPVEGVIQAPIALQTRSHARQPSVSARLVWPEDRYLGFAHGDQNSSLTRVFISGDGIVGLGGGHAMDPRSKSWKEAHSCPGQ